MTEKKIEKDSWNWHGQWEGLKRTYNNRCIDEENYMIANGYFADKQIKVSNTDRSELSSSHNRRLEKTLQSTKNEQNKSVTQYSQKKSRLESKSPMREAAGRRTLPQAVEVAARSGKKGWTFEDVEVQPASPPAKTPRHDERYQREARGLSRSVSQRSFSRTPPPRKTNKL